MKPATQEAHDLAAFIVTRLGRIETLKLQKIMYYCNAWSLALQKKPMFTDEIQAWKHGPVIPSIYQHHKLEPSMGSWPLGRAENLTEVNQALAGGVMDIYGSKSGWALRNLTHTESPWVDAWERCEQGKWRAEVISPGEIQSYFSALVEAGKSAF